MGGVVFTRLFVPAPWRQRKRILAEIGWERQTVWVRGHDEGEDETVATLRRVIKDRSVCVLCAYIRFCWIQEVL